MPLLAQMFTLRVGAGETVVKTIDLTVVRLTETNNAAPPSFSVCLHLMVPVPKAPSTMSLAGILPTQTPLAMMS